MTKRPHHILLPLLLGALPLPALADASAGAVERGAYLTQIMDCAGCHMPRGADGAPMPELGLSGGSVGFEIPGLGIFWPPNLTPAVTGLGGWSDEEIAAAIRTGVTPDGRILAPAMPWAAYAALSDDDVIAMIAYLRTLPPFETPRLGPVATAEAAPAPFYRVTFPAP